MSLVVCVLKQRKVFLSLVKPVVLKSFLRILEIGIRPFQCSFSLTVLFLYGLDTLFKIIFLTDCIVILFLSGCHVILLTVHVILCIFRILVCLFGIGLCVVGFCLSLLFILLCIVKL